MSPHVTSSIVALKSISLVLGGLVTYFAYRAYRRSGIDALGYLSVGFAVVTLGAGIAGVVDQVLLSDPTFALLIESATTAVGFAVIVYSLYRD